MSEPSSLARISAEARSARVVSRIREAMCKIEEEISEGGGVYASGRLSLNEVCRRAGVHPITLQGSAHAGSTKPMVVRWLEKLKSSTPTGRRKMNAQVTKRARYAEEELRELAAHFRLRENEIPRLNKQILELTEQVQELTAENQRLLAELSSGKVVRLGSKSKSK